jgi:CheY-like chemotaxis protein
MLRIINILLVDDDTLDQMEVARALKRKGIMHRLKTARNGEEALSMMNNLDELGFARLPDIILIDLNMPKMDGFEFLKAMKMNQAWKDIKIFVLTTSDEREDKRAAVQLGASGFITKPLKLESHSSLDAFNLMIDLMNMRMPDS